MGMHDEGRRAKLRSRAARLQRSPERSRVLPKLTFRDKKLSKQVVNEFRVHTCTVFYSYFRLHATIDVGALFGVTAIRPGHALEARFVLDGAEPLQKCQCVRQAGGLGHEVWLEALLADPARFPGDANVNFSLAGRTIPIAMHYLLNAAFAEHFETLMGPFKSHITEWIRRHAPARPRLLDIGGRARSGNAYEEHFPECDITTFDIVPDEGVHVVGDAHELSRHFSAETFDFAYSVSVFEHLIMPWKVTAEMNRVLKPGGITLVHSHQTLGVHDLPWDFYRFSDQSWKGLFNRYTGFEILATEMSLPTHLVTRAWTERSRGNEAAQGFECSSVIARKTGPATVKWDVRVPEILDTAYPRS